jgi:Tol biopolymer transport system component
LVSYGSNPVWSPDSKRLAYDLFGDLYVMDAATRPSERRLRRLTNNPTDINYEPIAWSRDGTCLLANRLHYVGSGENAYTEADPVIFNLATGERTRLPPGAAVEHGWFQHE